MNAILDLQRRLSERFPDATLTIDQPLDPQGVWWLDVRLDDHDVNVEWKHGKGFGITSRDDVLFGERADEFYTSADEAFERIKRLLLSGSHTKAPEEASLAELRRLADVTQVELARRLDVTQASVSKLERRKDMLIGTLRSLVAALGGTLEVRAHFGDETVRILFDEPAE